MEIRETMNSHIDREFRGLAKCRHGYIWLIGNGGAVCFGDDPTDEAPPLVYEEDEWDSAIDNQGPFTKYNGQLVLEND